MVSTLIIPYERGKPVTYQSLDMIVIEVYETNQVAVLFRPLTPDLEPENDTSTESSELEMTSSSMLDALHKPNNHR